MPDTAPEAAYPSYFAVAPDSDGSAGEYASVGGDNKWSWGPKQTLVDSTYFGGDGAMNRFPTLVDVDVDVSGHFAGLTTAEGAISDDTAQNTLFASVGLADPYVWVKLLFGGSSGHGPSVKCLVDNFKLSGAIAGVIEFSCSIKGSGLPVYA